MSIGSPPSPFSQNKQNEPAVAIDPSDPAVVVAGANDNIDMEACNAGPDNDCPFTERRRRLRRLLLLGLRPQLDASRPTPASPRAAASAWSVRIRAARRRPGRSAPCPTTPSTTWSPTAIRRWRSGPGRRADGGFSYANGSRLYYANLTSAIPGTAPFKGAEAIAVSHTDDVAAAASGSQRGVERSGDRQPPDLGPVLRQGAGVGRQRRVEPVLRQRLRLLRRLPRQRQRVHQPAARRPDLRATAATPGASTRSRRPPTTRRAATASAARAAPCARTRTASSTSSTSSSASARRRRPRARSR